MGTPAFTNAIFTVNSPFQSLINSFRTIQWIDNPHHIPIATGIYKCFPLRSVREKEFRSEWWQLLRVLSGQQ